MDIEVKRQGVKRMLDKVAIPESKRLLLAPNVAEQSDTEPSKDVEFYWSGAEKCPQWLADHLEVPRDNVARIEVRRVGDCGIEILYTILKDYFYHHGVDLDQTPNDTADARKKKKPDANSTGKRGDAKAAKAGNKVDKNTDKKSYEKAEEKADGKGSDKVDDKKESKPDGESGDKNAISADSADGIAGDGIEMLSGDEDDLPVVPFQPVLMESDNSDNESTESVDELCELSPAELEALEKQAALNTRESPGLLTSLSGTLRSVQRRSMNRVRGLRSRDPTAPAFSFGIGVAHTKHRGRLMVAAHLTRGRPSGTRSIVLLAASPDTLKSFCFHAKRWHFRRYRGEGQATGKYVLHLLDVLPNGKGIWRNAGQKESRSLNSIVLREGQLDAIIADFKEFKAPGTKKWYVDHGLPHRRSYLFYGPPGVGKTSTIRALAGELKLTACFLSLSDNHFQNKTLHDAVMNIPKPSMLVLEDIDVLFNENRRAQSNSFVTFSGLLNALDGLVSANGILTVMTTNHPDRLDPALTRAGRVDRRFEFKAPDKDQMKNYFLSFYPDADPKLGKKFADIVFSRPEKESRSIATLQEHFIYTRKKTAEECVAAVDGFFDEFYPHSKSETGPTYTM